jgi:hypothetical protein
MEDLLAPLAQKYGSDKFSPHFYTRHYHRQFAHLRDRPIRLLEIGVGGYNDPSLGGASLRMWRDYFPLGAIYGLDLYPKNIAEDRIRTYQGPQGDPLTIAAIVNDVGAPFDIIIDDGSHVSEHVIASFMMLFQHLAPDGIYAVEDLQTSYWSDHGGNSFDLESGLTSISFFKKMIDGLNWQEIHRPGYTPTLYDRHIIGMSFFHNLVFIQKGENLEGSNHVIGNRVPGQ